MYIFKQSWYANISISKKIADADQILHCIFHIHFLNDSVKRVHDLFFWKIVLSKNKCNQEIILWYLILFFVDSVLISAITACIFQQLAFSIGDVTVFTLILSDIKIIDSGLTNFLKYIQPNLCVFENW